MTPSTSGEPRPIGELLGELSHQLSTLIRQEALLARSEFVAGAKTWGRDVAVFAVVAVLAFVALVMAANTLVLLLIEAGLRPWVASAAVAVGLALVAVLMAQSRARAIARRRMTPVETVTELKETAQWIKNETTGHAARR